MRPVLIIDRDLGFAESLAHMLRPNGYAAELVDTPERAVAALRRTKEGGFAAPVALVDARLDGNLGGIDLVPRLRVEQPDLVWVLMSADLDGPTAVAALRRGAYDHFDKSGDPASLLSILDRLGSAAMAAAGSLRGVAHRQGKGGGGEPRQIRLPGDDEPRIAHAAQRHHRLFRHDAA